MTDLKLRDIPDELMEALLAEEEARGLSLEQTVIELLSESLGVGTVAGRKNGLGRFAGTWTDEEHASFERAVAGFKQVDEEHWR